MLLWHARGLVLSVSVCLVTSEPKEDPPCVSPTRSAGALLCLPRSLPNPSPRRRSQRGARAAQRARTTLTPASGDAPSATRKAPAAHPRSTGPRSDPLESRHGTGTNHRPVAPARNPYPRTRTPALIPPVTHIHAARPKKGTLAEQGPARVIGVDDELEPGKPR